MSEIKQINTGVAELLAVKVPKGAHYFEVDKSKIFYKTRGSRHDYRRDLPPGNWTPLGIDTELTEEQCRELMPSHYSPTKRTYYINPFNPSVGYVTAKEAFASLMQANGFYSKNPYGTNPIKRSHYSDGELHIADILIEKWQQAEANTGTWLVLKRLS